MWDNLHNYLKWLQEARQLLIQSKWIYDEKMQKAYYNKPYWINRFRMEIERVQKAIENEEKLKALLNSKAC